MQTVRLIHPFDGFAGSQRVASNVATALHEAGFNVIANIGFGAVGFLARVPKRRVFLATERLGLRRLLYPVWLVWMNLATLRMIAGGATLWANTAYSLPAVLLACLIRPGRVIVHIHELTFRFPGVGLLLRAAGRHGVTLVCVSEYQRLRLGLTARVVPNCVDELKPDTQLALDGSRLIFVGSTQAKKGFSLFLDIVDHLGVAGPEPVACLADAATGDAPLLARAQRLGVTVRADVTRVAALYEDGFATVVATDPAMWEETFSLVAAESLCCLVPVINAGSAVVAEVCGPALAFDCPARDAAQIAARTSALWTDADARRQLVAACSAHRDRFAPALFAKRVAALVAERFARPAHEPV